MKIGTRKSEFADITLGVPQGSVLGPLLFLIFINDLPYFLKDIYTKLFADDTTMLFNAKSTDECVRLCQAGIRKLVEWCECNRLYINWAKTFVMFATNRRKVDIEKVDSIRVDGADVKAVSTFRLLGITLDTKLDFVKHASDVALSATRKMFALKRIFYLSDAVRIHFLKTFILPCFDYGLSLIIYYSQAAIDKITKAFYKCIYHILKIDCSKLSISEINEQLKPFRLSSFQSRIFVKLVSFGFQVMHSPQAPKELKAIFEKPVTMQRYNFRGSTSMNNFIAREEKGVVKMTFKSFFATLLNKTHSLQTLFVEFNIVNFNNFKFKIFDNLNAFLDQFVILYGQFRIKENMNLFARSKSKRKTSS